MPPGEFWPCILLARGLAASQGTNLEIPQASQWQSRKWRIPNRRGAPHPNPRAAPLSVRPVLMQRSWRSLMSSFRPTTPGAIVPIIALSAVRSGALRTFRRNSRGRSRSTSAWRSCSSRREHTGWADSGLSAASGSSPAARGDDHVALAHPGADGASTRSQKR